MYKTSSASLIITSLGAVSQLVDAVHGYGGLVFHDIIKNDMPKKQQKGSMDYSGCCRSRRTCGDIHPFSSSKKFESSSTKPILLSGCISNGRDVASALQMGADLAYMGTRFINVEESKQMKDTKK